MTLYTHAQSNIRKTWLLLTGFLIFIILIGWIISYFLQTTAILWLAVILSIGISFFSYWSSDKIALAMAGAKQTEKSDNPELFRLVENLCITAGLPLPRIYVINDYSPNAFATGRNAKHAVLAVTTGLLDKLERVELEGVIAHELSHIGNRDMLLQTLIVVLVGVIAIITDFFVRLSFFGGTGRSRDEGEREGQARAIMLVVALALAILAPLAATLLRLAISRKREFLADASAALLTRYPEGLARALEKISQDPRPLARANNATAHLYIANPFKGRQAQNWLTRLFMTHPPVEERVRALRDMRL
jgi:heat shock protein HtpX